MDDAKSNLERLQELTPLLKDVAAQRSNPSHIVQYLGGSDGDMLLAHILHDMLSAAICYAKFTKGQEFPQHKHEVDECVVVITGQIQIEFADDSEVILLDARDGMQTRIGIIPHHIPHVLLATEESTLYAILIPRGDGF